MKGNTILNLYKMTTKAINEKQKHKLKDIV